MTISEERFIEIMDNGDDRVEWTGDNTLKGLNLIAKYLPHQEVVCSASHDIIYSVNINNLIEANITEDDVNKLQQLNWMVQDSYLVYYV